MTVLAVGSGIWMFIHGWRRTNDQHWLNTRSNEDKQFFGLETATGFDGKQHVRTPPSIRFRIGFSVAIAIWVMCLMVAYIKLLDWMGWLWDG